MKLTVSKVNEYIRNMFDYEPGLCNISVIGEVSNCKYHTSGHIYFTLKDEGGQLACVMFYGSRAGLKFKLESGQKVVVTGKISIYERDGKYQLYARQIEQQGIGNLHERYEQLKKKLNEEGLFAKEYKKEIPMYARKVGIITASTGAALQDIINISNRRNPYIQKILCPVLVQGEAAASSIAKGIKKMDEYGVDIIIVGRGGGSIEDLWAFNEEIVARACFNCKTPIISAVGHETDVTIIDYVSDLRAPTPSAAAELAFFDFNEYMVRCNDLYKELQVTMMNKLEYTKKIYENYFLKISHKSPSNIIKQYYQAIDLYYDKINNTINNKLKDYKNVVGRYAQRLDDLSPIKKLAYGYSYITDDSGKNIKKVSDTNIGDLIDVRVSDGKIYAKVEKIDIGGQ